MGITQSLPNPVGVDVPAHLDVEWQQTVDRFLVVSSSLPNPVGVDAPAHLGVEFGVPANSQ